MNVTIIKPEPAVQPPPVVRIELSVQEAATLKMLTCNVLGSSTVDNLWDLLDEVGISVDEAELVDFTGLVKAVLK